MYVEITAVSYDPKKEVVRIEATDLDKILLNSWTQEFPESAEVSFKFDIKSSGPRIYLYKLCQTQVKKECKTMEEKLKGLVGVITTINGNFMEKP